MLVKIAFFTDLEDSTIEFLVETDHDIEKELPELLTGTIKSILSDPKYKDRTIYYDDILNRLQEVLNQKGYKIIPFKSIWLNVAYRPGFTNPHDVHLFGFDELNVGYALRRMVPRNILYKLAMHNEKLGGKDK